MSLSAQQKARQYISARHNHPAWRLLVSPRAPLMLGCLTSLFEQARDGVGEEDALQALTNMLLAFADEEEFAVEADKAPQQAGRELREWIRRGLIIERSHRLYSTDALNSAVQFIESLDNRIMTTTASRLAVVQQQIEQLDTGLNPNPASRIRTLENKIDALQKELQQARAGHIEVLTENAAVEALKEVYALASGLSADFRRVEDSWREADRQLRQTIVAEGANRGDVVQHLLDGQQALLNTPEGRVFDGFLQQLRQTTELEDMGHRLKQILSNPAASKALSRNQMNELRWLRLRLASESHQVMQARARSEQDVKGFIKTGLASEHHRVGLLLNDIFKQALELDWQRQATRRAPSSLPAVGFALARLPTVERLRCKSLDQEGSDALDFTPDPTSLDELDDDFWDALDGLDREAMIADTLAALKQAGKPLTLAELAAALPPVHDLETFALWIAMAREAGIELQSGQQQSVDLIDRDQRQWRFTLPYVALDGTLLAAIDWDL
jgi:hypothetical protein